ncbi:MAG: Hint domain-containing protein [Paracoccaceae bacterium]|nr:Hint domain-containing protein [Paracoccaceae bacterium]
MPTTFEVLYLGTGPILDTTEGNTTAENGGLLVGQTYGSSSTPLSYNAQATLSPVDFTSGTSDRYNIDNNVANNTFSIDGGPAQTFDGVVVYNATISYTDGTPDATITAVVVQDTVGNLYLAPESSNNADQAALVAAPIESLTLNSVLPISVGNLLANRQNADFLCFAAGTRIDTARGALRIEALRPGDRVRTLDHGLQPIRRLYHSTQRLPPRSPNGWPVLIQAGALEGGPLTDLIVSANHRVLVGGQGQLERGLNSELLVPAKALTGLPGIRFARGKRVMAWVHLVCSRHEIVQANGCWAETLLLTRRSRRALGTDSVRSNQQYMLARPSPSVQAARRIIEDAKR